MAAVAEIEERISKCQRILDSDPNSQIFAALAEAFRKKGELDKAFRVCQDGLKIHPSYGSAHVVMAKVNLDRGLYDWAEAEVMKAEELDGASRAIDLLKSEIYIYKGDFDSAVRLLKKLHQADPNNRQIKKLLDIAIRIPEEQKTLVQTQDTPEATPTGEPSNSEEEAEAEPTTLTSKQILRLVVQVPGMKGALFLNREGLVVENDWGANLEAEVCGTTLAEVIGYIDRELDEATFGNVSTLLVETESMLYHLVQVSNGIFLFVGTAKTNLGTLRMKLESLFDKYQP